MTSATTTLPEAAPFETMSPASMLPAIVMGLCFLSMVALLIAPHRVGI